MLTIHQISKSYSIHQILSDISFSLNRGDRAGLIGPNGCGKTTLLRILADLEKPDSGVITKSPPNLKIGYLAQGLELDERLTIEDLILERIGDLQMIESNLAHLATSLANDPENTNLQNEYAKALKKLENYSHSSEAQVNKSLETFGILGETRRLPVGQLSGGQKTRLGLALLVTESPDVLLLDEPTNHLDISMLEWLENWLSQFSGAALIVSHDRTFLDHTVNKILDLDSKSHSIREYSGNYSDYLEQYLLDLEKQSTAYRDQENEIQRMRQDIARTKQQAYKVEITTTSRQPTVRRYAKKVAKKALSREKKLKRYLRSEERVEKPKPSWQMKLEFQGKDHHNQDVLIFEDLSIGYIPSEPLVSNLNLTVRSSNRIALTGPNGAGKTTLLRTIAGLLKPLSGRVRVGAKVNLGYMSQEQELLDEGATALEILQRAVSFNETEARSFLHFFLFSGDEPLRLIKQLSFGERARLSLAVLVAQGCDLLLLDEPINHLDIPSRERFEQALSNFEGTVLAVVHDRYFINRFASELWTLENQDLHRKILRF
jgi:ATP-binding cassette subfamily F protein 3